MPYISRGITAVLGVVRSTRGSWVPGQVSVSYVMWVVPGALNTYAVPLYGLTSHDLIKWFIRVHTNIVLTYTWPGK